MSKIEDKVCEKIQQRAEVGKSKYGVTMEEEVLSIREWLNHLQQELMDASVYVEKLLGLVEWVNVTSAKQTTTVRSVRTALCIVIATVKMVRWTHGKN